MPGRVAAQLDRPVATQRPVQLEQLADFLAAAADAGEVRHAGPRRVRCAALHGLRGVAEVEPPAPKVTDMNCGACAFSRFAAVELRALFVGLGRVELEADRRHVDARVVDAGIVYLFIRMKESMTGGARSALTAKRQCRLCGGDDRMRDTANDASGKSRTAPDAGTGRDLAAPAPGRAVLHPVVAAVGNRQRLCGRTAPAGRSAGDAGLIGLNVLRFRVRSRRKAQGALAVRRRLD